MDLDLIKNEIAQKDGFDTWRQMVEYFCTTEPGRKVIDKNITDLVRRAVADSTGEGQSNIPVVNQQRELLLAFCDHLNTYAGMEEIRFDFMMQDFIDKSQ